MSTKSATKSPRSAVKTYVMLIILPFAILLGTAILQFIFRFLLSSSGSSNVLQTVMNIISVVVGIIAVLLVGLIPLWIVLLVREMNRKK